MEVSGLKPSDLPGTPPVKTVDNTRWRAGVAVGRALFMAALILGWSVNQAGADTVMFRFTGTVTVIDPTYMGEIGGLVNVGDTLTGMVAYDPNRTGTSQTGEVEILTLYLSPVPPGKMSYSVGGLSVTTPTSPQSNDGFALLVGNGSASDNVGEVNVDTFIVGSGAVRLSTTTVLHSVFRLEDPTQSVFSNTLVPTSLNLDDFEWRSFEVYRETQPGFAGRIFETSIDTISPIDIVNDLVSLSNMTTSSSSGQFRITATFQNGSRRALRRPFFEVIQLTGGNLLANADGGAGGVGATLTPDVGDEVLSPGESTTITFVVGLRSSKPFQFRVNVRGEVGQ